MTKTKKTFLKTCLLTASIGINATVNAGPFQKFEGQWALKNDQWEQRWDGKTTERISIPNHRTDCQAINTENSILCVVSSPDLKGHILWSFDPITNKVHHLSSFGTQRNGFGAGEFNDAGHLSLKIVFPSEGQSTHRLYRYEWVSENEYILDSQQYYNGKATGNFYRGRFVRIAQANVAQKSD